jgi:hypothetical protein
MQKPAVLTTSGRPVNNISIYQYIRDFTPALMIKRIQLKVARVTGFPNGGSTCKNRDNFASRSFSEGWTNEHCPC